MEKKPTQNSWGFKEVAFQVFQLFPPLSGDFSISQLTDKDDIARTRHEFMIRNDKYQAESRRVSSLSFNDLMKALKGMR